MGATRTETALVYLEDEEDRIVAQSLLPRYKLATEVRSGGITQALQEASSWISTPDYLVLDVSNVEDPVAAILELANEAPSGESEVIIVGRQNDINMYRRLCELGVSDYELKPLEAENLASRFEKVIDRRRESSSVIDPENLIVVTGTRGGVGASMIATSLAHTISNDHQRRTLLVDLDLHGGVQSLAYNVDPTPGLFEILKSPKRVDALFLERTIRKVSDNLLLLGAAEIEDVNQVSEEGLDALLSQARQGLDYVVLDLPRNPDVGKSAILTAGTVVVVATLTLPSLRETVKMINTIESKGYASNIIVVVNRVGEHKAGVLSLPDFSKEIKREVIAMPFDPRSATQSMLQATPLTSFKKPISDRLLEISQKLPSAPATQPSFFGKLFGN